ncbi:MAG: amidohydrolase family protein, partial [Candidatus Dormibacteraceae bacterium]
MDAADVLFLNGQVVTCDDTLPAAEALAVRGERILAVGSSGEVLEHRGPATEVVDLGGRALLPGFVEAHGHPIDEALAVLPPAVDIRPFFFHSHDEVVQKIRSTVAALPAGQPQLIFGYDLLLMAGARELDRQLLDQLAP